MPWYAKEHQCFPNISVAPRALLDTIGFMVRRIVVANEKGGVGKTTTAVNLAHGLALLRGSRVLLVDLDTQAGATISLGYEPWPGSHDLLISRVPLADVCVPARPGLDLVPSNEELALAALYLSAMEAQRGRDAVRARARLSEMLREASANYDFVVLDCGPGLDILTLNAFTFADDALVPVALDYLSEIGTLPFVEAIGEMQQYGRAATLRYVVPTFYQAGLPGIQRVLDRLQDFYKDLLTEPIRRNIRVAEAPEEGQTIFEYAPNSAGAQDYTTLVDRVYYDG